MNKTTVLGLDISTSITGATIIQDNKVIENFIWDTRNKRKFPSLYDKAAFIRRELIYIEEKYKIDSIYIEQSLQSFRSGFSSAKTLSTLSRFNGIVSWLLFEIFEIKPEFIGATAARKQAGIKVPRGQKAKKVVLEYLLENEPAFNVEYTRHGNPKPESYDRADAIVIAKAGWKIEN